MKRSILIALLCVLFVIVSAMGTSWAEEGDAVDTLLKTWENLYGETSEWNAPESLLLLDEYGLPRPDENDIPKEEAREIAARALLLFLNEDADFLVPYLPSATFSQMREWNLSISCDDLSQRRYLVTINGQTGKVVEIYSYIPGPFDDSPGPKG